MATINYAKSLGIIKIVYFGMGESGKSTSIEVLHKKLSQQCGDLIQGHNERGRTITFDYLPIHASEDVKKKMGINVQFSFFTVAGQREFRLSQRDMLRKVDGIVFVVDSHESKFECNLQSFADLETHLNEYGISISEIPLVFQYNKRDLPPSEKLPLAFLNRQINPKNKPSFGTIATSSKGIVEAALKICQICLVDFKNNKTRKGNK
jgi:signal recognition particle receptor subunit beta